MRKVEPPFPSRVPHTEKKNEVDAELLKIFQKVEIYIYPF